MNAAFKRPDVHASASRVWGGARVFLHHSRRLRFVDLLVILGSAGLLFGALGIVREWHGQLRPVAQIDLSPLALPRYAFYSLSRGILAYLLSLGFTLVYGYWAAKDKIAERVLVPLLDILQSIPVLGFMPGLVLALVALFPSTNAGLELAAVLMIFTGQAWNMTFSFYHSLRSVPPDLREAAAVYRFDWWRRLTSVELPFATMGLVWNSMMSMAGGWFFLMISEAFVLGSRDFRLPGLGSYMSVAVAAGNLPAMLWAVATMVLMIVVLDQLVWRPVVVWAQKFRIEEGGAGELASSWFLNRLRRSRILRWLGRKWRHRRRHGARRPGHADRSEPEWIGASRAETRALASGPENGGSPRWTSVLSVGLFVGLLVLLAFGAWKIGRLVVDLPPRHWVGILGSAGLTLGRVLLATALGTLWALPAGLAIGLSPRLSRVLQPVVQVAASFPAPMLYPAVVLVLTAMGVTLDWGSVVLMLLGTQWYILFNVVAGAMALPSDLREASRSFGIRGWRHFWVLAAPGVFPYLVTGWVTAAGGAWNASIVSEFVTFRGNVLTAHGLGAQISLAAARADFPTLAANVVLMAAVVVLFNRTVWRRLYHLAETRFSLAK
jgi:NitT/TauT family transport system permease protein